MCITFCVPSHLEHLLQEEFGCLPYDESWWWLLEGNPTPLHDVSLLLSHKTFFNTCIFLITLPLLYPNQQAWVLHYLCEASAEEQAMHVLYTHTRRVAKFLYLILSANWKQLLLVWVKHVNALNHKKEALTFQIIVIFPFPSSCITQSGLYIWDPAVLAWICDTQTVLWSYFCPEITLCISITSCREELIK